jgi:hypothetical protein
MTRLLHVAFAVITLVSFAGCSGNGTGKKASCDGGACSDAPRDSRDGTTAKADVSLGPDAADSASDVSPSGDRQVAPDSALADAPVVRADAIAPVDQSADTGVVIDATAPSDAVADAPRMPEAGPVSSGDAPSPDLDGSATTDSSQPTVDVLSGNPAIGDVADANGISDSAKPDTPAASPDVAADSSSAVAEDADTGAAAVVDAADAVGIVCETCSQSVPGYSVARCLADGNQEMRLCKDGQHFGSIVLTSAGALSIRPHPGKDPNGWGSSLYLQAFLSGQTVLSGASRSVEGIASTGIAVKASGPVNAPASTTYGTWSWQMTFAYDSAARAMTTTGGTYSVSLNGLLSAPAQDLNVARIASNYLHNVPLLNPPNTTGDTGDMQEVVVSNGLDQTWSPPANPGFYPQDTTDHMTVDVKGHYNVVDTARQGLVAIAAAYKPSLTLTLANRTTGLPMIFGAAYDTAMRTDFSADNVGVTPIVLKSWTGHEVTFDVVVTSSALPGDATAYP